MNEQGDFVATELLRELRHENVRKDARLKKLNTTICAIIIASFVCLLTLVCTFIWYINKFDTVTVQPTSSVHAVVEHDLSME